MARRLQGRISIDGIDIAERPLRQLRQFVVTVHQVLILHPLNN